MSQNGIHRTRRRGIILPPGFFEHHLARTGLTKATFAQKYVALTHTSESTGISTYKRAKYDHPLDRRTIELILRIFDLPEDMINTLVEWRSRFDEEVRLPFLGAVCA